MMTATNKRRIFERLGRATMFGLLALVAVLYSASEARAQWVTNGDNINTTNTGNVGIGTANPITKLQVNKGIRIDDDSGSASGSDVYSGSSFMYIGSTGGGNLLQYNAGGGLDLWQYNGGWGKTVTFARTGNVGIGTTTPSSKLHVEGNITASGSIAAKYQDVAEWVPSTQKLAAGTVVVVDAGGVNHVLASASAYDTSVAGVVSEQPGLLLGEEGEGKVKVATTGRVKVRVDATRAPIRAGDLLVTSEREGYAMKSEPVMVSNRKFHSPGTIIGKALEPLEKGTGEILVLLSLQ